jgi:hypothetical protein
MFLCRNAMERGTLENQVEDVKFIKRTVNKHDCRGSAGVFWLGTDLTNKLL